MGEGAQVDLGIVGLTSATRIGEGGNAVVYRAQQPELDRHVAVKILKNASSEDIRRRFDRERRVMGRLSQHDGIVTVYDSGFTAADEPYIVMPLLSASLEDELATSGPLPWREAAKTIADVCRSVGYAHENGIVHRDLKPANIMRAQSGRPLVADFGISRIIDVNTSHKSTALTLTPAYSPPETLEAAHAAPLADVYSLGATLYALIAGHPPFLEPGREVPLIALMRMILEEPVPPIPGVPDDVHAVLARSMAKAPLERYGSAEDMAAALELVAGRTDAPSPLPSAAATIVVEESTPAATAPADDAAAASQQRGRLPTALVVGGVVLLVFVALGVALLLRSGQDTVVADPPEGAQAAATVAPTSAPAEPEATVDAGPAALPTSVPAPQQAEAPEPAAAPPASIGELLGPVDIEPYVAFLAASDDALWASVPRGGETVSQIDPAAVLETQRFDFGFLPVRLAVNRDAIYGSDITGMLGRIDRANGEVATAQLDQKIDHLEIDERWLWVVTSTDGRDAMLRRFDPTSLTEDAATPVGDFVFNLTSADTHVWVSESSSLVGRDAASLDALPTARPPFSSVDDLDAAAGIVWATGGQFDSELSEQDLALATVVALDAASGATLFETVIDAELSVFDQLSVAASEQGAWVTNQTNATATFVNQNGVAVIVAPIPEDTLVAEVFDGDLWLVAGGSTSGKLYRLDIG